MPKLKIFSSEIINELKNKLESTDYIKEVYSKSSPPLEFDVEKLLVTHIEVPIDAPILQVKDKKTYYEAENAIALFEYLGELNSTQAADMRLWSTLAHTKFWDYSLSRWNSIEKTDRYILEHWFDSKKGGLAALRRNSISRLWWAAYLTVAPWEKDSELEVYKSSDRFVFTKILFSQQQIYFDVMERLFGSNLRLRICWLHTLSTHLDKVTNKDNLSKALAKSLSIVLKTKQLEALPVNQLEHLFSTLADDCVKSINSK